ncbi:MAG: hypothetical protein WDW38_002430 [Sanguina aurantia]
MQLVLPPSLTPRQRAVIHEAAGAAGLGHSSIGEGDTRQLTIGTATGPQVVVDQSRGPLSDADLCTLLQQHLSLDATPNFESSNARRDSDNLSQRSTRTSTSSSSGRGGRISASRGRGRKDVGRGMVTGGTSVDGRVDATGGSSSQPAGSGTSSSDPKAFSMLHPPAASSSVLSLEEYVSVTGRLLEMERQAEVDSATEAMTLLQPATAQAKGRALLNLRLCDSEGGLLGRTLLTLVPNKGFGAGPPVELPPHKFSPHDVVALRPNKAGPEGPALVTGVVYRVKDCCVIVAVDDVPDEGLEQPLRLEKLANEVTFQRLKDTLGFMSRGAHKAAGHPLMEVMFGGRGPRFQASLPAWKPFNAGLDASQLAAVSLALAAQDVALVHGPPGTGKTTAVVELILQEVARGSRVMATAASNIAVDNLVERLVLASPRLRVVRMGHPARLSPSVLDSCLESHVLRSDNSALAKDVRREIKGLNSALMKLGPRDRAERRQIRCDLRSLAKEERNRQSAAIAEVIKGAVVLCTTLTGASHPRLRDEKFDLVVVDEAAQALEAATWAGLLKAPRAVLAGDHLQLPPTIISDEAARQGLGKTLFERLQHMYPGPPPTVSCRGPTTDQPATDSQRTSQAEELQEHEQATESGDGLGAAAATGVSSMLTVQYRMHSSIMQWSSDEMYKGLLTASPSVAAHTLHDLLTAPNPEKNSSSTTTCSSKIPHASPNTNKSKRAASAASKPAASKPSTAASAAAAGISGNAASGSGHNSNNNKKNRNNNSNGVILSLPVLLLIDTAGCGCEEEAEEEGDSKANSGEVRVVLAHVARLVQAGVPGSAIGIITPYNAQVALLREARVGSRLAGVEISSVDGFQGREKEAVIISMVRSNGNGSVGFLSDARRMNVAVTRAKRHVALVCDTETVGHNPFLKRLVQYFEQHGDYSSAAELVE